MRQSFKKLLVVVCLVFGLQSLWAFSLLGPDPMYPGAANFDPWQVTLDGFNPLPGFGPPGFIDQLQTGPKNLGEGYRRNTPVMYYAFDPSFTDYFLTNGEFAVQQAFDILNGLTNVDTYSAGLTEFPLNSQSENYQANALDLVDLKSTTLSLLMEQLGLADAVRYTWSLHDRYTPPGATCNPPGPGNGLEYTVVQRNFDITASPLNQLQYSAYVNGELYTYYIIENCGAPGASPPNADAFAVPAYNLDNNPPVASGNGEAALLPGFFYTGLTRDDVAGLRWLYSTNNLDTASPAYRESPAAGSFLFSTNFTALPLLYTSNYNALVSAAMTNDAATLQVLYPGLLVTSVPSYYTNIVSIGSVTFVTNFPIGYPGGIIAAVSNYTTNLVLIYQYSFGNVVTNKVYSNTSFAVQTITFGPQVGQPSGGQFVLVTNTSAPFQSNVPSGDFFILTNGACGPAIVQTNQITLNVVTNTTIGVTNANGTFFVQNLISYFTNYTFAIHPCTLATNTVGDYQGLGRIQFMRVRDDNYDYQNGQFIQPITNQYTMVVITNGQAVTRTFQRVLTAPDFLFGAQDFASGPDAIPVDGEFLRNILFNLANAQPSLAGPGTIDPGSSNIIFFNKVGPVYDNFNSPFNLTGPTGITREFLWGSFDGTTNAPVVYPNGTSIANLAASALVQISPPPPTLPNGIKGVAYNVQLTATNTIGPLTWTLASNSAGLPLGSPNLTLSPGGLISGTPTNSATYVNIVIQMMDSSVPPRTLQMVYSLTIN